MAKIWATRGVFSEEKTGHPGLVSRAAMPDAVEIDIAVLRVEWRSASARMEVARGGTVSDWQFSAKRRDGQCWLLGHPYAKSLSNLQGCLLLCHFMTVRLPTYVACMNDSPSIMSFYTKYVVVL